LITIASFSFSSFHDFAHVDSRTITKILGLYPEFSGAVNRWFSVDLVVFIIFGPLAG
jgi:hypothetical protein